MCFRYAFDIIIMIQLTMFNVKLFLREPLSYSKTGQKRSTGSLFDALQILNGL